MGLEFSGIDTLVPTGAFGNRNDGFFNPLESLSALLLDIEKGNLVFFTAKSIFELRIINLLNLKLCA